jgi:hypothetical protein
MNLIQNIPRGTDPGMMQSIEKPFGGPRMRRRVCNLTAERRQKRKERTRAKIGSRRKSAAACRKVPRRAKVAWRKRNLFWKIRNLEKCGRRKDFAAARIRTTCCAKVARRKGRTYERLLIKQGRRKNKTEKKIARGTRRGRMLGRRTDAPGGHQWNQEPGRQGAAASWK